MTLITLPSGTVLANDYTLPIIVVSKVLMANENNPHAKLYPYYFTIMYANGVSIPIIAKTLADAGAVEGSIFVLQKIFQHLIFNLCQFNGLFLFVQCPVDQIQHKWSTF